MTRTQTETSNITQTQNLSFLPPLLETVAAVTFPFLMLSASNIDINR